MPRPRHHTSGRQAAEALARTAPLVSRWIERLLGGHEPPLTVAQYLALQAIDEGDVVGSELARRTAVSPAAVSQLLAAPRDERLRPARAARRRPPAPAGHAHAERRAGTALSPGAAAGEAGGPARRPPRAGGGRARAAPHAARALARRHGAAAAAAPAAAATAAARRGRLGLVLENPLVVAGAERLRRLARVELDLDRPVAAADADDRRREPQLLQPPPGPRPRSPRDRSSRSRAPPSRRPGRLPERRRGRGGPRARRPPRRSARGS